MTMDLTEAVQVAVVTQIGGVIILIAKNIFDARRVRAKLAQEQEADAVRRKHDLEARARAEEERTAIMQLLKQNTDLTLHAVQQSAKAAGTPLDAVIKRNNDELDRLMRRFYAASEESDAEPNVQAPEVTDG